MRKRLDGQFVVRVSPSTASYHLKTHMKSASFCTISTAGHLSMQRVRAANRGNRLAEPHAYVSRRRVQLARLSLTSTLDSHYGSLSNKLGQTGTHSLHILNFYRAELTGNAEKRRSRRVWDFPHPRTTPPSQRLILGRSSKDTVSRTANDQKI